MSDMGLERIALPSHSPRHDPFNSRFFCTDGLLGAGGEVLSGSNPMSPDSTRHRPQLSALRVRGVDPTAYSTR